MRIVVAGAGSIGCFVGGMLASTGHQVTLLGRARILGEIAGSGLTLTDYDGMSVSVLPDQMVLSDDPAALGDADLVLVTVKTAATPDMAELIRDHAPLLAPVISLQNGFQAVRDLRAALPMRDIRAGMVPFNVVPMGRGRFHRATSGEIVLERGADGFSTALGSEALPMRDSPRIEAVQWGKLLMNLSNAPNALSGLTVHEMLMDRGWRRVIAAQMAEAVRLLRAAGQEIEPPTSVSVGLVPHILRLPTPLFRRVAASMLTIDPTARTSMAQDLAAGRLTEIDALQGEVIALAQRAGHDAPWAQRLSELVHASEAGGPSKLSPEDCYPQTLGR